MDDTSSFEWKDITYSVKDKKILHGISGKLEGLCAVMGPSGSGKTSLMNILASRVQHKGIKQCVGGTILLNGAPTDGARLRRKIAYVVQQDLITPTSTAREAITFSAALRLPASVSSAERTERVNKMIADLGLEKCADTLVGDERIRGLSGGEKKRTAVAVELIMSPSVVFLDEPTSGLDSYAAENVVLNLHNLASKGTKILCTIHQPSSQVFHLFDKVLMLRTGSKFYEGPISTLAQTLAKWEVPCPEGYNIADHVIRIIETGEASTLDAISHESSIVAERDEAKLSDVVAADSTEQPSDEEMQKPRPAVVGAVKHANSFVQLFWLAQRELHALLRNKPALIASVIAPIVLNLLFACIFFQAGDQDRDSYSAQTHFGAITQIAIGGMFGAAQPLLLKFPLERGIFLREYASDTYNGATYFISKMMIELPQGLIAATLTYLVSYWMMGLHGSFVLYVLTFWILGIAAASTALFIGSIATNAEVATQAAPGIFVPQLLFAGFFIQASQIPVWLRWAQYLCSLKYAMNLYILNEFGEQTSAGWDAEYKAMAETFISSNDIEPDQWWVYMLILILIPCGFRFLSILVLQYRAKSAF